MKDLFILIGFIIAVIYFILIFLSRPDLRLGIYAQVKFGYNKWLCLLVICAVLSEIVLLIIYTILTN